MIVQIILNHERVGGPVSSTLINTDLLRNYTPVGNNMPLNLAHLLENANYIDIMAGNQPDWWDEEEASMREQGIIFNANFERSFEIAYC